MLLKLGWKVGNGLGARDQGRKEPVNIETNAKTLGIGKMAMDLALARNVTADRRMQEAEMEVRLDPEKVAKLRAQWKSATEKKEAIDKELKEVQSVFFCVRLFPLRCCSLVARLTSRATLAIRPS